MQVIAKILKLFNKKDAPIDSSYSVEDYKYTRVGRFNFIR